MISGRPRGPRNLFIPAWGRNTQTRPSSSMLTKRIRARDRRASPAGSIRVILDSRRRSTPGSQKPSCGPSESTAYPRGPGPARTCATSSGAGAPDRDVGGSIVGVISTR